jgi:mono/diheme cytochrome c family protein
MKKTIMFAAFILSAFTFCVPATAADGAAGQKTFEAACAACHQLKSYAGKSESDLVSQLNGIVAGSVKHPKKLTLSSTDIANVAAYISSNEPK